MSPDSSIQKPYPIASLPRPVNQSTGQYVVGDVHGGTPGSRKRKRAELAVGIDGEGLNLYDIQDPRLITSYALPPQCSFTCAPCSTLIRDKQNGTVVRRSYVSTVDDRPRITLFQDITAQDQTTLSTTITHELETSSFPVVQVTTLAPRNKEAPALLIVRKDGQIKCLGGEKLDEIWTSSPRAIGQSHNHDVLYTQLTDASTASKGLLKGLGDVLLGLQKETTEEENQPEILLLITASNSDSDSRMRYLQIVALPRLESVPEGSSRRSYSVQHLITINLQSTSKHAKKRNSVFSLHAPSGVLTELCGDDLFTFDLADTLPKVQSMQLSKRPQSFLRLSSTSIVTSTKDSIDFYNPKYRSLQATLNPNASVAVDAIAQKRKSMDNSDAVLNFSSYRLLSYFPRLDTVVGIAGNELVALQVDTSPERPGKRRPSGLLIDSLGCGLGSKRPKYGKPAISNTILQDFLPTLSDEDWTGRKAALNELVKAKEVDQFDNMMASYFGTTTEKSAEEGAAPWIWPGTGEEFPIIDKRIVLYALGHIFSWNKTRPSAESSSGSDDYQLSITLHPQNTLMWLIETGNLTVSNIETSLKHHLGSNERLHVPAGQLVNAIVAIDPTMSLLLSVISKSKLGADELLHAIRLLTESLEFPAEEPNAQLLTNGEPIDTLVNGNADAEVEKEEAAAEMALDTAEYHLGDGSSIRGQALSIALAELHSRPASTVVSALRNTFSSSKTVFLIRLLRHELVMGSWTSLYMNPNPSPAEDEAEDGTGAANNSIVMIANLLNCCIDAVGTGGWLLADSANNGSNQFEAEDLIDTLKLEVSAALQGLDEATYIKGLTSEMIRFGKALQKGTSPAEKSKKGDTSFGRAAKVPLLLPVNEKASALLPIGLKAGQRISTQRVGAGGEVKARSKRDIGRLKSQQVGKYSLERIVI